VTDNEPSADRQNILKRTLTSIFTPNISINVTHRPLKYIFRSDDEVKKDKMDRACSTNGGEEAIGGKARRKETTRKTKT
jgi:hypothetical protein